MADALTTAQIATNAQLLATARHDHQTLESLPHVPETDADAYAVQEQLVELADHEVAGWKIGATSAFAQEFLGCEGPFAAPMFAHQVYESGGTVPQLLNPMMEPEIAVVLGADLGPATPESARAAVAAVRPSIELVGGCFPNIASCGYRSVVADRGANLGVVLGPPVDDWETIDLGAVPVALFRNDDESGSGVGADALGGPMHALAWLANHLAARGRTLRAGDIVTTGTIGGVAPLTRGDRGRATHGPLGEVSFTLAL